MQDERGSFHTVVRRHHFARGSQASGVAPHLLDHPRRSLSRLLLPEVAVILPATGGWVKGSQMPVRVSPAPYHAVTPDDDAGETLIRDGREAVLAQLAAGGCPALKHVARLAVVGSEQLQQKGWRRVGMCKGGGRWDHRSPWMFST